MSVVLNGRPLYLAYEETLSGVPGANAARIAAAKGLFRPDTLANAIASVQSAGRAGLDLIILDEDERSAATALFAAADYEPFTLGAFLAARTQHIGLALSARAARYQPFNLARLIASADHISHGRTALNLKTDGLPTQALPEYLDVLRKLWDSWEDDAFLRDTASGQFVRPEKLHAIEHGGPHYKVQGPLNVARPPQGNPPIIAAWDGRHAPLLAADILRIAPANGLQAAAWRARLPKGGARLFADTLLLLAPDNTSAWARYEATLPASAPLLQALAAHIGLDARHLNAPALLAEVVESLNDAGQTLWLTARQRQAQRRADLPQEPPSALTAADLLRAWQWPGLLAIGTPATVAARVRHWSAEAALDGLVFRPLGGLDQLHPLHHELLPLLAPAPQPPSPPVRTLRERLHLPRPNSRYTPTIQEAAAHV